jgi:hypothetical protein
MRESFRSGRWAWGRVGVTSLAVFVLLLVGAAAVAAQRDVLDPNAEIEQTDISETLQTAEEMTGRSPNEMDWGQEEDSSSPALDERDMAGISPNAVDEVVEILPSAQAASVAVSANSRQYFITLTNVNGAAADTTCPAGYHMASLFEMGDVTDLVYASDHAAAKLLTDQGSGPAAGWWGWARTGGAASVASVAGRANCNAWASSTSGEYGTLVRLNPEWVDSATTISPWEAQTWSCAGTAPVWCMED